MLQFPAKTLQILPFEPSADGDKPILSGDLIVDENTAEGPEQVVCERASLQVIDHYP